MTVSARSSELTSSYMLETSLESVSLKSLRILSKSVCRRACSVAALLVVSFMSAVTSAAQSKSSERDSLVVLISATSAQAVDISGASYRKVIGPARFLHNNTYLLCDTAFWNVDSRFIEAIGHVSLIQDETMLTSDKLTYLIDESLAQFRGGVVQLEDKDHNTLRTRHLDYNTADSVAVFKNGGAMRDKDGQIIESVDGSYDSKTKVFKFEENVNMFSDTLFVKSNSMEYNADRQFATFGTATDMWNKDNMLSSDAGWYDRSRELFLFNRKVHLMTDAQEAWSDSLYYYRDVSNVEMLGNVQITDTTRSVSALGGRAFYCDSLSSVSMTRKPVVVAETADDRGGKDTVYIGAESFLYYTKMMFEVDSTELAASQSRISNFSIDPVGEYRKKAAEAAAKAAEEAAKNDPNYRPQNKQQNNGNQGIQPGSENKQQLNGTQGGADGMPLKSDKEQLQGGDDTKAAVNEPQKNGDSKGKKKNQRDKAKKRGKQIRQEQNSGLNAASADSISVAADSILIGTDSLSSGAVSGSVSDSTRSAGDSLFVADSLSSIADSLSSVDSLAVGADSLSSVSDSLYSVDSLSIGVDSLALADSLAEPLVKDSTKVGFIEAMRNVKLFRKDMQMACDSLLYCDLDSLVRLFINPAIWQEGTRQYAADSISVMIKNQSMDRASLMSDAFISIMEDDTHFDQIKGTEMMAYFDKDGGLQRFDVLGGASALFYLKEHEALATVNKKESKMLSATFKDGDIERIYYYDAAKSDGYPVVQLSEEERKLKGFNWAPERRPAHKDSITTAVLRPTQRREYESRPQAQFRQTNIYFPGYIDNIHRQIEVRDSLKAVRRAEAARARQLRELALRDSLAKADSIALADSLYAKMNATDSLGTAAADSLALIDSLAVGDLRDSLAVSSMKDSLSVSDSLSSDASGNASDKMTKAQLKEQRRKEKKEAAAKRKAEREAAREKRWEEADSRDAQKKILKDAKKLEKERARKRKALEDAAEQYRKDQAVLERYKSQYEKKNEKKKLREAFTRQTIE